MCNFLSRTNQELVRGRSLTESRACETDYFLTQLLSEQDLLTVYSALGLWLGPVIISFLVEIGVEFTNNFMLAQSEQCCQRGAKGR